MSQAKERKTTVVCEGILVLVVVKGAPIALTSIWLDGAVKADLRSEWSGFRLGQGHSFPLFNSLFLYTETLFTSVTQSKELPFVCKFPT
jgi:hypothetical protein